MIENKKCAPAPTSSPSNQDSQVWLDNHLRSNMTAGTSSESTTAIAKLTLSSNLQYSSKIIAMGYLKEL